MPVLACCFSPSLMAFRWYPVAWPKSSIKRICHQGSSRDTYSRRVRPTKLERTRTGSPSSSRPYCTFGVRRRRSKRASKRTGHGHYKDDCYISYIRSIIPKGSRNRIRSLSKRVGVPECSTPISTCAPHHTTLASISTFSYSLHASVCARLPSPENLIQLSN